MTGGGLSGVAVVAQGTRCAAYSDGNATNCSLATITGWTATARFDVAVQQARLQGLRASSLSTRVGGCDEAVAVGDDLRRGRGPGDRSDS